MEQLAKKPHTFDDLFEKHGEHMHRVCPREEIIAARPNGLKAYFEARKRHTAKQNAPKSNECVSRKPNLTS